MDDRRIGNIVGFAVLIAGIALVWLWIKDRDGIFLDYAEENRTYAASYFDGLFPYDEVLASQRWHPRGAEAWDCTYAVVSISDDAPADPGRRAREDMGWQFVWGGGDWQPTPAAPLGNNRDAVGFCARRLPEGLGARLQNILEQPGSYYVRGSVGETVYIYAPKHGLAANIRYGD